MPLPLGVPPVLPPKYKFNPDYDDFENILPSSTSGFNISDSQHSVCNSWDAASYPALKLSLVVFTSACVVPHKYQLSALLFRTMLVVGCGTHLIWGLQLCSPDIMFWNSLFFGINIIHCLIIVFRLIPSRLSREHARLYKELFKIYKVDKNDFQIFANFAKVSNCSEGEVYANEQLTVAGTKLSLLISGRIVVSHRGSFLYDIKPYEFFDCHEWTWRYHSADTLNPRFQVTLTASEPSKIMIWSYGRLERIASGIPNFFNILRLIISRNALEQLYSVIETNRDEIITTKLFSVSNESLISK